MNDASEVNEVSRGALQKRKEGESEMRTTLWTARRKAEFTYRTERDMVADASRSALGRIGEWSGSLQRRLTCK